MKNDCHPETLAAQALGSIDAATGAVVPPIHITTTYERDDDNQYRKGFVYARTDNATVRQAEDVITALEGGVKSLLFGSGMAAATTALLALPRPAHVIAPHVMYWSLRNWLITEAASYGITTTFVDATRTDEIAKAIKPGQTKLIWLETPSNPVWSLSDINAASALAHAQGALVAVDSTAATPVLSHPLKLGADIVMHSATKYLNGHSDVLAGSLTFAREDDFFAHAVTTRRYLGAVLSPFDAALLLRGLRTLHVRVAHQCRTAMALAERLGANPRIAEVLYPGLPGFPGHELAARQMKGGFGGMMSIRVSGGETAAIRAAAQVRIWKRATSLGGVESLIEHRASIEGPGSPCPTDLLRLSVGLEHVEDLAQDLERALLANS